MKKIFGIFLCVAFIFALSANLFADGKWIKYDEFDEDTVIDFRPSKDVSVYYDSDNSTAVNLQEYTVGTKHKGGDTVFSSSSGDSNIYKLQSDTYRGQETVNTDFPTAGSSEFEEEGWEKL